MPNVKDLCGRLEIWLGRNLPTALASLNPGATDRQIAEHERVTGFQLPEDVRAWFAWRNGQKRWPKESIFFGDEMLSLEESLKEWKEWQQVADMNEEIAEDCTSNPDEAIVAAYSLPGWIPLAKAPASANYLGIDLNPGPKGTKGQAIYFGRDVEAKSVLGASFGYFLEFIIEEMEAGRIKVGVASGSKDPDLPWTVHSLCRPRKHFDSLIAQLYKLDKFDGKRLQIDEFAEGALRQ